MGKALRADPDPVGEAAAAATPALVPPLRPGTATLTAHSVRGPGALGGAGAGALPRVGMTGAGAGPGRVWDRADVRETPLRPSPVPVSCVVVEEVVWGRRG